MTYRTDCTQAESLADLLPEPLLDQVASDGISALPELMRLIVNAAMLLERQRHLHAGPHERSVDRTGYANGFKEKSVKTRLGEVTFSVPQVRDGSFYPSALDKGSRSERALKLALAEMYVCGVSTRKVARITEELCGFEVSSTQVSRVAAELDAALHAWRNRPLGAFPYVFLDARYEKVRHEGQVRDAAVLIATGVSADGKRAVLGVSVALSEHEIHWRRFMESLAARGLCGVLLMISDDHSGLRAARKAVFGGTPWQRCQFHLQQNAQAYIPKLELKPVVASDIRAIFNSSDSDQAQQLLKLTIEKYHSSAPKLAAWMEDNLPEGFAVFSFPAEHRARLRTTNGLERINQEIRRRTRVARLFPNEQSCLRLITAILMEYSDEWETEKTYLTFRT